MRIEVKLYNDDGALVQTMTANPEEVDFDTHYEDPYQLPPFPVEPIRIPENRIESFVITLKKLVPQNTEFGRNILITTRDEQLAPSWKPTGWYRLVNADGSFTWESKKLDVLEEELEAGLRIERSWKRIKETEWRPV